MVNNGSQLGFDDGSSLLNWKQFWFAIGITSLFFLAAPDVSYKVLDSVFSPALQSQLSNQASIIFWRRRHLKVIGFPVSLEICWQYLPEAKNMATTLIGNAVDDVGWIQTLLESIHIEALCSKTCRKARVESSQGIANTRTWLDFIGFLLLIPQQGADNALAIAFLYWRQKWVIKTSSISLS